MSLVRKRYLIWLVRAYIKRWRKTIFASILLGSFFFFLAIFILNIYILPGLSKKLLKVGYWGVYAVDSIPNEVLEDVSYGLTKIKMDGSVVPSASYGWMIKNGGKEYIFKIKRGQYFHNGEELNAHNFPLDFKGVSKKALDEYTISFILKDPYSPFLTTLSAPIFSRNLSGIGDYKIKKIDEDAGFVKSIKLESKHDIARSKIIYFYPTQEALKTAYLLGEIDRAIGVQDANFKGLNMADWKNTKTEKTVDYRTLIILFYNNSYSILSDRKTRQALSYAIPKNLSMGERSYSPIPPISIYFSNVPNYGISDVNLSKRIFAAENDLKGQVLDISVPHEYEDVAKQISSAWKEIGVETKIKIVKSLPDSFQILLYPIKLPPDPDQYILWHSEQANNIIKYKNLRIDKLLEDGRSTVDQDKRVAIYSEFQKYLIDDAPVSFLFFPYRYTLVRR